MGLGKARLGIVGLRSMAPTEQYGSVPAGFWLDFSAATKADCRDFSEEFSDLMLVKSEEELAQMRYAAAAAESACRVVAAMCDVGVGEEEVFAEATAEMLRHGIGLRYPMIVMNSGPHTLSWGPPHARGEAPRTLERGRCPAASAAWRRLPPATAVNASGAWRRLAARARRPPRTIVFARAGPAKRQHRRHRRHGRGCDDDARPAGRIRTSRSASSSPRSRRGHRPPLLATIATSPVGRNAIIAAASMKSPRRLHLPPTATP